MNAPARDLQQATERLKQQMQIVHDSQRKEQIHEQHLTKKHYETLARWAKEIGLGALGALIAPQLIENISLSEPALILGIVVAVVMYSLAFYSLKKS